MFGRKKRQSTVLVVETSELVRKLLSMLLESEGAHVICVEHGNAALDALKNCQPDLVLTELKEPLLRGLAFLRCVRTNPALASVPVVMVTSTLDEDLCRQALAMGADGFLTKPFTVRAIAQVYSQFCSQPSQEVRRSPYRIGVISDCNLQRHLLKQFVVEHGYEVTVDCHPADFGQADPATVESTRLWMIDLTDPEDESWLHLTEQLNSPALFGVGQAPLEKDGHQRTAYLQWERRLLNKIETSLFGRVISRPSEYAWA